MSARADNGAHAVVKTRAVAPQPLAVQEAPKKKAKKKSSFPVLISFIVVALVAHGWYLKNLVDQARERSGAAVKVAEGTSSEEARLVRDEAIRLRDNKLLRPLIAKRTSVVMEVHVSASPTEFDRSKPKAVRYFRWGELPTREGGVSVDIDLPVYSFVRKNTSALYLHLVLKNVERLFNQAVYTHQLITYTPPPKKLLNLASGLERKAPAPAIEQRPPSSSSSSSSSSSTGACEADPSPTTNRELEAACLAAAGEADPAEGAWTIVYQKRVLMDAVTELSSSLKLADMPAVRPEEAALLLPPALELYDVIKVHEENDGLYIPVVTPNTFWGERQDFMVVNASTRIVYATPHNTQELGLVGREVAEFKQLYKSSPTLLVVVIAACILHTVLNALAFKNDVQFWHRQRDLKGLSATSQFMNLGMQVVILLYLLDGESVTTMLIGNYAVGVAIQLWKTIKIWRMQSEHKADGTAATVEEQSIAADQDAAKYVFYAMAPLLVLYSVYSFLYDEHKGVYSFVLTTCVRFVYWFSFAMMTPQLLVNYRLKSVAHMPWRALFYKGVSTFIDDLFAFAMTMPTAHRLACLRDDVIFIVYLVQLYLYKVDKTRVNEFGQCGLMDYSVEELQAQLAEATRKLQTDPSPGTMELAENLEIALRAKGEEPLRSGGDASGPFAPPPADVASAGEPADEAQGTGADDAGRAKLPAGKKRAKKPGAAARPAAGGDAGPGAKPAKPAPQRGASPVSTTPVPTLPVPTSPRMTDDDTDDEDYIK
eukprot:gene8480-13088_t